MPAFENIRKALLEDRSRRQGQADSVVAQCFLCGRSFWPHRERFDEDDNSRFCSAKCRDSYDFDGARPIAPDPAPHTVARWHKIAGPDPGYLPAAMVQSGEGFRVACRGCGREFVSKGLAFCTDDCRRQSQERAENKAIMAEVGMEASTKRPCEYPGCTATIPIWRKGRRVPKNAKFCDRHSR